MLLLQSMGTQGTFLRDVAGDVTVSQDKGTSSFELNYFPFDAYNLPTSTNTGFCFVQSGPTITSAFKSHLSNLKVPNLQYHSNFSQGPSSSHACTATAITSEIILFMLTDAEQ